MATKNEIRPVNGRLVEMINNRMKKMNVRRRKDLIDMTTDELYDYAYSFTSDWPVELTTEEREQLMGVMMASAKKMRVMHLTPQERAAQLKRKKDNQMKKEAYEMELKRPKLQTIEFSM